MARARTLIPYLWSLPIFGTAWYIGWFESHDGLYMIDPGWFLLALFTGYTITLVACSSRAFTKHQLGHLIVFVAATFMGVLASGMDYHDLLTIFFSLGLAFWDVAITFFGALILLFIRLCVTRRKRPEAQV
jgi:hypothetical protein